MLMPSMVLFGGRARIDAAAVSIVTIVSMVDRGWCCCLHATAAGQTTRRPARILEELALFRVWVGIWSGTLSELVVAPSFVDVRKLGCLDNRLERRGNSDVEAVDGGIEGEIVPVGTGVVGVAATGIEMPAGGGNRVLPILARSEDEADLSRWCILGRAIRMSSWMGVIC